jgi:photosystem II stability/assembly factor-like uncharacterized protein
MMRRSFAVSTALMFPSIVAFALSAAAQVNPGLYAGLKWRDVGPFHGGRISSVTGVIGQPGTFYMGTPQGGIWKTTSAGVTWFPIFDQETSVDSIGAVQVAPSNPGIVYAGAGDPIGGSLGNGMWKSTDAGKTWQRIGLEDTVKITRILIDPADPNLVMVSALGDKKHHGGGVYRSTDGGQTWTSVLKPANYDGVRDLEYAFDDPSVMVAATQGTGGFGFGMILNAKKMPPLVFKSTDEGKTWTQIRIPPFPGRVDLAIAMHTQGQRMYIVGNDIEHGSGLYRSDDGGATWKHMAGKDTRIENGQGAYSCGVWVDSQNPDVVYTASTALYRSTDGGVTFHAFKGAPGGEDYHKLWIDPTNGKRMVVGADQGASVTLDNGKTWSLWYTEPIAQVYHVATDDAYPYHIMAAQQDTGAVMISSRGDWGQVDITDWSPVPASEFGVLRADPKNPNIIYAVGYGPGGGGSGLVRIDMANGQWQNVAPNFGARAINYRAYRDFQKKFDVAFDPGALYVAYQCLLVSHDGAHSFTSASPDLTVARGKPEVPCGQPLPHPKAAPRPSALPAGKAALKAAVSGTPRPAPGATGKPAPKPAPGAAGAGPRFPTPPPAIADFDISRVKPGVIWTVSTNGQIYNTMDHGKLWTNVTDIADVPPHTQFNTIDAGDNVDTAYVAGRIAATFGQTLPDTEDADVPLIWRTEDGGKTWTKIVNGLPADERTGSWVNSVRVDPDQPGLLFAGTETTVYVSFDHGDHWQSLRQNLPSTSIRDLEVHTDHHQNDLVIGTYGRGFWVLDDIAPLRQIAARAQSISSAPVYFFEPEDAIRARKNANWDQPFSIEVPHAKNPPYGAILDYYLSQEPTGPITLQVFDAQGNLVRTMSSKLPPPIEDQWFPRYWLASPRSRSLSTHVGLNRVAWDLNWNDPPAFDHDIENQMNMVEGDTTPGPHGPQVIPGVYTLKLTVDGQVYTRKLTVVNDPRVGQSPALMAALRSQYRLTLLAYHGMEQSFDGHAEVEAVESQLAALMHGKLPPDVAAQAKTLDQSLAKIGGAKPAPGDIMAMIRRMMAGPNLNANKSFVEENNDYNSMVSMMQVGLDMAPTPTQIATWENDCKTYNRTVAAWKGAQQELTDFNELLRKNQLQMLTLTPTKLADETCSFAPEAGRKAGKPTTPR